MSFGSSSNAGLAALCLRQGGLAWTVRLPLQPGEKVELRSSLKDLLGGREGGSQRRDRRRVPITRHLCCPREAHTRGVRLRRARLFISQDRK